MRRGLRSLSVLTATGIGASGLAVAALAGPSTPVSAAITPPPSANCQLADGVQHVIEITFDNVHFNRDNPDVPSDVEQLPALKDFIESNGTLLSNNHTPLIAHTTDDSITNYTGLYGDRHGVGISNNYDVYNSTGTTVTDKSAFAYWTGTYGLNAYPNQPYSATVPAAGSPPATPPAPWVPFTAPAATSARCRPRTWCWRTPGLTCRTCSAPARRRSTS